MNKIIIEVGSTCVKIDRYNGCISKDIYVCGTSIFRTLGKEFCISSCRSHR